MTAIVIDKDDMGYHIVNKDVVTFPDDRAGLVAAGGYLRQSISETPHEPCDLDVTGLTEQEQTFFQRWKDAPNVLVAAKNPLLLRTLEKSLVPEGCVMDHFHECFDPENDTKYQLGYPIFSNYDIILSGLLDPSKRFFHTLEASKGKTKVIGLLPRCNHTIDLHHKRGVDVFVPASAVTQPHFIELIDQHRAK